MKLVRVLLSVALAALLFVPSVSAQEESGLMSPGDIDISVSGGLGGLLYPHLQPSVDVGVVPLGPVVLSVGGSVDAGICALCGVFNAVSDWTIRSWYISALGTSRVHIRSIAEAVGDSVRLDPYAGFAAGPRYYRFSVSYDPEDVSGKASLTSILMGPLAGARFYPSEGGFFVYGEFSYLIELGFESVTVDAGAYSYKIDQDYRSGGLDFGLGIGLRL